MKRVRRAAIAFAAVAIIVLVGGTALNWPAASAAQGDLAKLYGKGRFHVASLKVNGFEWACGLYALPAKTGQWKFVERRSVLWAEEKSEAGPVGSDLSKGEQRWSECMAHTRRGANTARLYALEDWITLKLLGVLG